MIGISDIAKDVGVSISLVSKVLSGRMGKSSVRPELAAKIHATAKKLGYIPNATAQALVTGRQNVIGVFLHKYGQAGSGLVEAVMSAISEDLAKNRQRMLLRFFNDGHDLENCLDVADRGVVDGVFLACTVKLSETGAIAEMLNRGLPVVGIGDEPIMKGTSNVGLDQTEVGHIATLHLLDRGCRRIVHFSEGTNCLRAKGYRLALEERGIPYDKRLSCPTRSYTANAVPGLLTSLLAEKIQFDGVVATSDAQAAVVMNMLLKAGKRIPQDVKIIGTDDSPYCRLCMVPLSSVSGQNHKRVALATQILQDQINGASPMNRLVEPVVVERESTSADA